MTAVAFVIAVIAIIVIVFVVIVAVVNIVNVVVVIAYAGFIVVPRYVFGMSSAANYSTSGGSVDNGPSLTTTSASVNRAIHGLNN